MWIVYLALRRPYSVAVFAALIFIAGIFSIKSMLIDIFPSINIPVVGIVWTYPGLLAEDMERRVVLYNERAISTTVGGISRIESQSIPGIGLLRVYFEPNVDIGGAVALITAVCQTILRVLPPGMQPPNVTQFNASDLPVIQMTMTSDSLPEETIADYALNFIRIKLFTIPGLSTPGPYGGKTRQINIDVDQNRLLARGLSSEDIVSAVQAQNLTLPAGTARIGDLEYNVLLNSSPTVVERFNDMPVKIVNSRPVRIGDVARVSDEYADQTNLVRINGKRAAYLSILRKEDSSTLDVINSVKKALPEIQATSPKGLKLKLDFDQSVFVKSAIWSVIREAAISSTLVALMILLFLGSWRSVVVVCTSIPLAILSSIVGLNLTGNSINLMTLGGLSLAIGMLVDDATVEIENINRNRALGLPLTRAILTGAHQIALPAIMATLAICVVFFPVGLLTGPARYLFTPMALSVVFAMMMSYLLSRTLVPALSRMLLAKEAAPKGEHENRLFPRMGHVFERFQGAYDRSLHVFMEHRGFVGILACGVILVSLILPFIMKEDFFPTTDTGLMKLRVRAPSGTRIETMDYYVEEVEKKIRGIIPKEELENVTTNIGVPTSFNLAFIPTDNIGGMDAEMLIALGEKHLATEEYKKKIRETLNNEFPGFTFYFQAADIVSQVLNFGLTAPIDVEVVGKDMKEMIPIAQKIYNGMRAVPGAVDVNIKQVFDYPTIKLDVDRVRAGYLGMTQRDVANSMLVSLSSSTLVSPSYYLNPSNSVNYPVVVKTPLPQLATVNDLLSVPITAGGGAPILSTTTPELSTPPALNAQRIGNLSTLSSSAMMNEISHANVQRVINITSNIQDRDLGGVVSDIKEKIKGIGKLPAGNTIEIRGQSQTMHESFTKLGLGILLAMVLVYLLMVILFQSWIDPFIIMIAVPGALIGVLWMLALTGTSINVESLMGAIMAVGIAASNSILLVSFANDARVENEGMSPVEAALKAGKTRLRPVLMTATAMILGMAPAALALGEGGEQNAPLGRAVIGGLLIATLVTLFIVPLVYAVLRKNLPQKHTLDERLKKEYHEGVLHEDQSTPPWDPAGGKKSPA